MLHSTLKCSNYHCNDHNNTIILHSHSLPYSLISRICVSLCCKFCRGAANTSVGSFKNKKRIQFLIVCQYFVNTIRISTPRVENQRTTTVIQVLHALCTCLVEILLQHKYNTRFYHGRSTTIMILTQTTSSRSLIRTVVTARLNSALGRLVATRN